MRFFLDLRELKSDLAIVSLDGNHRIVKLDEEISRRLWVRSYYAKQPISIFFFPQLTYPLVPGNLVLEGTFQFPKEQSREMSMLLSSQVRQASTALRLSRPGSGFIRFHNYEYVGFFPETGTYGFPADISWHRFSYAIDGSVAAELQKRWPDSLIVAGRLERTPPDVQTHIRLAIERLNSSFDKKVQADQFLDYMIALEALCSRKNDAVSYRVALRVSTLIAKDATERQAVFDLISEAYKERSNLAHGRPSKLTDPNAEFVRTYILRIEEVLIKTIHYFIRAEINTKKKEEVLKIVDTAIATQDRTMLENSLTSNY